MKWASYTIRVKGKYLYTNHPMLSEDQSQHLADYYNKLKEILASKKYATVFGEIDTDKGIVEDLYIGEKGKELSRVSFREGMNLGHIWYDNIIKIYK